MQPIPESYNPPDNTNQEFPPGKYKVKGFSWFKKDQEGNPILVAQKDGKLVGRLKFVLENGDDGPPMSVTLPEMILLAKAFGLNIQDFTPIPKVSEAGKVSRFMAQLAQQASIVKMVEVKNGWVSDVQDMQLPEDYFYFSITDISPKKNGQPYWLKGEYGGFFFVEFTIHFGEGGSETPYAGVTHSEPVNYAITVVDGKSTWATTEKEGRETASAKKLSNLMKYSAPTMFNPWNPEDHYNVLPYWLSKLDPTALMKGSFSHDKQGKIRSNLETVKPVGNTPVVEQPVQNEPDFGPSNDFGSEQIHEGEDQKARVFLKQLLDHLAKAEAVTPSFDLTKEGIPIARSYLSPLKQSGVLPHADIKKYTYEHVTGIFNSIVKIHPDDDFIKKLDSELSGMGLGLDEVVEEWALDDESPF